MSAGSISEASHPDAFILAGRNGHIDSDSLSAGNGGRRDA